MIGIIDILRDDATLGALIGGTGTSARVYPMERPQTSTLPAVSVTIDEIEPTDTKDGVSTLDTVYVAVVSYDTNYGNALDVANAARDALDRVTEGTYQGETIQTAKFESRLTDYDEVANKGTVFYIEDNYKVRVKR